jgi:ribose transport system substrate-binding protein
LQVDVLSDLKADLKASPSIRSVSVLTTGSSLDIPQQLQQFAATLRQHPDLIIAEPLQPEAFVQIEAQAGQAGIPVVNFLGDVVSPYALNVNNNTFQTGAEAASVLVRMLGGKGRVLFVHGYPTATADVNEYTGAKAVLAACGMSFIGEIDAAYVNATAKSETLKFIATHPGTIDGAIHGGGMGQGIMSAFLSSGRPMPIIADIGAQKGSISYWLAHRRTYHGVGTGQGAPSLAAAIVSVALRTLAGKGPKINTFLPPAPLITDANLGQWSDPGWKFDDLSLAPGPRDSFLSERYLDGLFRSPGQAK